MSLSVGDRVRGRLSLASDAPIILLRYEHSLEALLAGCGEDSADRIARVTDALTL